MHFRHPDQVGKEVILPNLPVRIVSLVPSQTELLHDLCLGDRVIGITKFCCRPPHWFKTKIKVGGTKNPKLKLIKELRPDLIIANKEENNLADIENLREEFPVWTSDVTDLTKALDMIRSVGLLTGSISKAEEIISQIEWHRNHRKTTELQKPEPRRVCYLIWKNPYMSVGSDTFIHDMLESNGFENVFADRTRYPETSIEEIMERRPELVFLSSEPYPFKEKDKADFQPIKTYLVDGESFSWYGSRLLQSFSYFRSLLTDIQTFS